MSQDISGWTAVAWVAGMGGEVLLAAAVAWLRARSFRDRSAELPTYRTVGKRGSHEASNLRALAVLMLLLFGLTQLLYVGVYVELAQWQLWHGPHPPRVSPQLFFWVCLVTTTCVGATLHAAITAKD